MSEPATEQPKQTKSAQKKAERQKKKDDAKAKRQENPKASATQEVPEENATNYGTLPLIQSQSKSSRVYTSVQDLTPKIDGETVWIRGRLQTYRGKGNLGFLVIRQSASSVQAVLAKNDQITKGFLKFASGITKESLIEVEGTVKALPKPLDSTTQNTVEVTVQQLFVVSLAASPLPIQVADCEVPQPLISKQKAVIKQLDAQIEELKKKLEQAEESAKKDIQTSIDELVKQKSAAQTYVVVSQPQRLDNRVIELRTTTNQAIFRLQSAVCQIFREYLTEQNFIEIHTPKLISAVSEGGGGADVFRVKYFEGSAYLAQSPQLYKQMAICADLERVFEIAPVFRAEKSLTRRHMTEFMGLDLEMAFQNHYHEVLDVLDGLFVALFDGLKNRFSSQLDVVRKQFPFEDLQYLRPSLRLKFPDAIAMLREAGVTIGDLDDLGTEQEIILGKLVKEKYQTDFFILDKFPLNVRPFYTMPDPENPNYSNSYDFFLRGQEILSGAQRVHDSKMLEEKIKAKGIDPSTLKAYIEGFKYGAPPHGGGGIGLERVVMLYLGLKNIRKSSMFPRDPLRLTP